MKTERTFSAICMWAVAFALVMRLFDVDPNPSTMVIHFPDWVKVCFAFIIAYGFREPIQHALKKLMTEETPVERDERMLAAFMEVNPTLSRERAIEVLDIYWKQQNGGTR